ncbi:MAG TPA: hypothetical protein VMG31_07005 [Verrucomicrobiae bacterium]|nr:hypothetical protein [Verrucomicrobiae bacterium]
MTSIRKFVYAGLLALTALSFVPVPAYSQTTANGQFTLPHDVHWQNAVVPAGEYSFKLNSEGAMGVLTLSKLSGSRTSLIFLVNDTDELKASGISRLVLDSTASGSYVSAMQLPQFGITLHFAVPAATEEKQMAKAETTGLGSAGK